MDAGDDMQEYNPNYIGGDIAAGAPSVAQLISRPVLSADPWRTPAKGLYLCSSSTPPGPGVHGMGGWHAARGAAPHQFGIGRARSVDRSIASVSHGFVKPSCPRRNPDVSLSQRPANAGICRDAIRVEHKDVRA